MSNDSLQPEINENRIDTARRAAPRQLIGAAASVAIVVAVMVFAMVEGITALWSQLSGTAGSGTSTACSPSSGCSANTEQIHIVIRNVSTPDGEEPAYVGPNGVGAPDLFTAYLHKPVTLTIDNESGYHTFTVDQFRLNVSIGLGTTVIHFTPTATGQIAWGCTSYCGVWVMAENGYMEGNFDVKASA